ncbi:hypothetical protein [Ideonella margarita]|uniref:ABC transporter permease n=1 Tax=Ideonella margarita TaxID=2984191 RepID=A0ABU9C6P7_9BURK
MRLLVRRPLLAFLATAALLVLVVPIALYWAGLNAIDALPMPPSELATLDQQSEAWQRVRGRGEPEVHPLTPYSYLFNIAAHYQKDPGGLAAWLVARNHLLTHRQKPGMF